MPAVPKPPRSGRRRMLRCDDCWQTFECRAKEVIRFAQVGWPTCCGRPMELFAWSVRPGPDGVIPESDPNRLRGPGPAAAPLDLVVRLFPPEPREPGPGGIPTVRVGWSARTADGAAFAASAVATPADGPDARVAWMGLGHAADWLVRLAAPVGSIVFEVPEPAAAGRLLVAVSGLDAPADPYLRKAAALVHRLGCGCGVRSYHPPAGTAGAGRFGVPSVHR